jgi:hypothetical protein
MRKLIGVSALALCLVLPCAAQASKKHCTDARKVQIDAGKSPTGEKWQVVASVRNNAGCRNWLLALDFSLPPIRNWGSKAGIPAGGHISRYFKISAMDVHRKNETVFSGYVGREVATIKAWMQNGAMIEVHPRFPSMKLRKTFVWLRSFKYFVDYFSAESLITKVSLFTRGGRLVYRTTSEEGEFW